MTVHLAAANADVILRGRMLETTQTTGTGAYALDGVSVAGRRSFVAGVGTGNKTVYTVESGSSWETGVGTVTAGAPNTISRDFILDSSNGNAAVDWPAGVKTIFGVVPALLLDQILSDTDPVVWDVNAADMDVITVKNSAGLNAVKLRITAGDHGSVNLRNASNVENVVLSTGTRGSLVLNTFEVYPLAEGLQAPVNLTGTSVNITVRSDARRITIHFGVGCSSNGTSSWLIQLGDSGGVEPSGYASTVATVTGDQTASATTGFRLQFSVDAASSYTGEVTLTRVHATNHTWQCKSNLDGVQHGTGVKTLSGAITTVRITTTNGTDGYDGGTVVPLVE